MTCSPEAMAWLLDRLGTEPRGVPAPDLSDVMVQNALYNAISHHRLGTCLPDRLIEDPAVPPELRHRLLVLRRRRRMRVLRLAAETAAACAALTVSGVPHLVLKGITTGVLLHDGIGARDALDIDLLVPHDAIPAVTTAMTSRGYHRVLGPEDDPSNRRPPPVAVFRRENAAAILEVHTGLADDPRLFPWRLPFDTAVEVRLGNQAVPALPREVALIYAAFHGWKHFWTHLVWLTDMAAAARHPAIDWRRTLDIARSLGCERHLALGMLLANDLLGAPVPEALAAERRLTAAVEEPRKLLAPLIIGSGLLRGAEPAYRMGLFTAVRCDVHMHSCTGAKLAALRRHLRPTADDRKLIRLPDPLYFFYYGFRIVRLPWRAISSRHKQP